MWQRKEWKKQMLDSIIIEIKDLIEDWVAKPFIWFAIIMANIEN